MNKMLKIFLICFAAASFLVLYQHYPQRPFSYGGKAHRPSVDWPKLQGFATESHERLPLPAGKYRKKPGEKIKG